MVFTWGGVEGLTPGQSTVEFLLEPHSEGTLVLLRHYGLPRPALEPHRRGWVYSGLVKLKDAAEGRTPSPPLSQRHCPTRQRGVKGRVVIVNWWMFAGGLMAMSCAAGHAIAGLNMFYRPIKSAITNELHAGILTGMWHLITIHFVLSGLALLVLGTYGRQDARSSGSWRCSSSAMPLLYLGISLRLGGALKLFQWIPFSITAILAATAAVTAH